MDIWFGLACFVDVHFWLAVKGAFMYIYIFFGQCGPNLRVPGEIVYPSMP